MPNLATKYASKIDETIINGAQSGPSVNQDYDFIGAKTVKVYSFDPVAMNDYTRSGTNRYGSPSELDDTTQELQLTKDRSFSMTIDKGNKLDSPDGVRDAAKALRRQIDEAIIPELDKYRFTKIAQGAGHVFYDTTGITASTAYQAFLEANGAIDEADVPAGGRVCNCSPKFLNLLKQDDSFIKAGDLSQNMLIKGQVGEVDGVAIVKVASSRLPAGCLFEITHSAACVAPVKIQDYKVHDNPPGINGMLIEGRVYYDAFVLNKKAKMVAVYYGDNGGTFTVSAAAGADSTHTKLTVSGNIDGGTLVAKDYASAATAGAAVDIGDDVSSFSAFPSNGIITTASGHYVAVAVRDASGKVVASQVVAAVIGA